MRRGNPIVKSRVSSVVEQRFCKPQAVGSNPSPGTSYPSENSTVIPLYPFGVFPKKLRGNTWEARFDHSMLVGARPAHKRDSTRSYNLQWAFGRMISIERAAAPARLRCPRGDPPTLTGKDGRHVDNYRVVRAVGVPFLFGEKPGKRGKLHLDNPWKASTRDFINLCSRSSVHSSGILNVAHLWLRRLGRSGCSYTTQSIAPCDRGSA
jgi:hypothetical protein